MPRSFYRINLDEALTLVPTGHMASWDINAAPRPASEHLRETFQRLESFDTVGTDAGKALLANALLGEIVSDYPGLKVFKGAPLKSDHVAGFADFLIARRRAYAATPLLFGVETRRDDFTQGQAQCVAGMTACRDNHAGSTPDISGIVTSGQLWEFYQLTGADTVRRSGLYALGSLPQLLGALDFVIAACAKNLLAP